jgi:hypothetical protein
MALEQFKVDSCVDGGFCRLAYLVLLCVEGYGKVSMTLNRVCGTAHER